MFYMCNFQCRIPIALFIRVEADQRGMTKLEDLRPNASRQGILPNCLVTVVNTQWFGAAALETATVA